MFIIKLSIRFRTAALGPHLFASQVVPMTVALFGPIIASDTSTGLWLLLRTPAVSS